MKRLLSSVLVALSVLLAGVASGHDQESRLKKMRETGPHHQEISGFYTVSIAPTGLYCRIHLCRCI